MIWIWENQNGNIMKAKVELIRIQANVTYEALLTLMNTFNSALHEEKDRIKHFFILNKCNRDDDAIRALDVYNRDMNDLLDLIRGIKYDAQFFYGEVSKPACTATGEKYNIGHFEYMNEKLDWIYDNTLKHYINFLTEERRS